MSATPLHSPPKRVGSITTRWKRSISIPPRERIEQSAYRWTLPKQRVFPFDQAWAPSLNSESLAPQLFAVSLFPYLGFLYYLTQSNKAPKLMLFGFYFLLVFVGVSIPAGIYAKSHYGTSLSNVDWLHGSAELFLCITNLLIVMGLRQGIREAYAEKEAEIRTDGDELGP